MIVGVMTLQYSYKWKNHFSEMKGGVGMSPHEKEGEQEDAYTKTGSPLHLCFFLICIVLFFVQTRHTI